MTGPPKTPSPMQELEVVWWAMAMTPSFLGVTACLRSQFSRGGP